MDILQDISKSNVSYAISHNLFVHNNNNNIMVLKICVSPRFIYKNKNKNTW